TPLGTAAAFRAFSSADFDIFGSPLMAQRRLRTVSLAGILSKSRRSMANSVLPTESAPRAASGTLNVRIQRLSVDGSVAKDDRVAVEAPLEFQLHHPALGLEPVSFGTTMRTPGDDEWLAAGLLYGEGIVNSAADIDV